LKNKSFQIGLSFVLFVLCSIAIIGCDMDAKQSTGLALKATKDVLVETGKAAKALCESGAISEADCFAIKDAYADGREILLRAKDMWDGMVAIDSFVEQREYQNALIEVARMSAVIEGIIREYD
jgi:hypothetical protein